MAARAMWKADLALGEIKVPVKLYAAVQDTKVHFRLLHAADHTPVKQQMVDPETERAGGPDGRSRKPSRSIAAFSCCSPKRSKPR